MNDGRSPELADDRPLVVFLAAGVVLAVEVGTRYAAWRFGYDRRLGPPLVTPSPATLRLLRAACVVASGSALTALVNAATRRAAAPLLLLALGAGVAGSGPVYAPDRLLVWYARHRVFAGGDAGTAVFDAAWVVTVTVAVVLSCAIAGAWGQRRGRPLSEAHGSAHWDDGETLRGGSGLVLGRHRGRLLRYAGEGHVLTVAPTRSGKGVSCVIPNLLDHPGSMLVTDPKGENYAVTAAWRRSAGQSVYALDPFGVVGPQASAAGDVACYNPIDLVDPASPGASDDARTLADMLVVPEGRGAEQAFWNEEARALLAGIILHAAASPRPLLRTLTHVRTLLTLPPDQFACLLDDMAKSAAAGGLVARAAARIRQKADKERSSVLSTAQSHTHFLDSPRMAQVLGTSSIDLAELKRGQASVYLVLPAEHLEGYARWLRLMIAAAILSVTRVRGRPRQRVLFLLDEFAHLGPLRPVQQGVGLAGGFGATFWLVVQDLSQLRSTYGDAWPTFLANADVLQAFGTNDWETADYLSKMTGEATIRVTSETESRGTSRGRQPQSQQGRALARSEKGRRLLLPDEVRRLPAQAQLLFVRGNAPLLVERLHYFADPAFAPRAGLNPLYAPVADSRADGATTGASHAAA